jgi:hypothetical protein
VQLERGASIAVRVLRDGQLDAAETGWVHCFEVGRNSEEDPVWSRRIEAGHVLFDGLASAKYQIIWKSEVDGSEQQRQVDVQRGQIEVVEFLAK